MSYHAGGGVKHRIGPYGTTKAPEKLYHADPWNLTALLAWFTRTLREENTYETSLGDAHPQARNMLRPNRERPGTADYRRDESRLFSSSPERD
jgi:hypothetical protein